MSALRDRIRRATLQNPGVVHIFTLHDEEGELKIEVREPSYAAKMSLAQWAQSDGQQPEDAPTDDPRKEYEPTPLEQGLRAISACCYEPGGSEPLFTMDDIDALQESRGDWLNDLAMCCYKVMAGKDPNAPDEPEPDEGK